MKVDQWGYRKYNREGCGVEMKQILLKKACLFEPSNALILRQAWTRWGNSVTTRRPIHSHDRREKQHHAYGPNNDRDSMERVKTRSLERRSGTLGARRGSGTAHSSNSHRCQGRGRGGDYRSTDCCHGCSDDTQAGSTRQGSRDGSDGDSLVVHANGVSRSDGGSKQLTARGGLLGSSCDVNTAPKLIHIQGKGNCTGKGIRVNSKCHFVLTCQETCGACQILKEDKNK